MLGEGPSCHTKLPENVIPSVTQSSVFPSLLPKSSFINSIPFETIAETPEVGCCFEIPG